MGEEKRGEKKEKRSGEGGERKGMLGRGVGKGNGGRGAQGRGGDDIPLLRWGQLGVISNSQWFYQ